MYIVLGVVSERMDTTRRREVGVGAIQSRWRVSERVGERRNPEWWEDVARRWVHGARKEEGRRGRSRGESRKREVRGRKGVEGCG